MTSRILAAAEEELETAFNWYQQQRQGLGLELLAAYRVALGKILEAPNRWPEAGPRHKRVRLDRFPYGIFYRIVPQHKRGFSRVVSASAFLGQRMAHSLTHPLQIANLD